MSTISMASLGCHVVEVLTVSVVGVEGGCGNIQDRVELIILAIYSCLARRSLSIP